MVKSGYTPQGNAPFHQTIQPSCKQIPTSYHTPDPSNFDNTSLDQRDLITECKILSIPSRLIKQCCPTILPSNLVSHFICSNVKKEVDNYNKGKRLNTSLHVPGWPRFMSKVMMRLITENTQSLTLRTISQMTQTLCKTQTLKTY